MPFTEKKWLALRKDMKAIHPPDVGAPEISVLLPNFQIGAKLETGPTQIVRIKIPIANGQSAFTGEKGLAAAAKIAPNFEKISVAYCKTLGGYVVMPGTEATWLLKNADQKEKGRSLPVLPTQLLRDIDSKESVRVRVGNRQEGFGSSVKPSGRKFWNKYPIRYGDGMYTRGEFIRIDKKNFLAFLDDVQKHKRMLAAQHYFFSARYFTLKTIFPGSTLPLKYAIADGKFAFTALCQAAGDAVVERAPSGILGASQKFKVNKLLAGTKPEEKSIHLTYSVLTVAVPSESTIAKRPKPIAKIKVPIVRMMRGPYLSTSQPWSGPSRPLSIRVSAKAQLKMDMDQPNSACNNVV